MTYTFWRLVILSILLGFFSGCSKDDEVEILRAPGFYPPVTGIYLSNEVGFHMGTYGKPSDNSKLIIGDCDFRVGSYPNPSTGIVVLSFYLGIATPGQLCTNSVDISFFIAPINNELNGAGNYFAGSVFAETGAVQTDIFRKDITINPTRTEIQISLADKPPGFYRIYVKINNQYLWRDIYHATDCVSTPPGLRTFLPSICN